jgi:hypothetical protein
MGLPQSGSEKIFGYKLFGGKGKHRDNCYDYAFNDDERHTQKSVPGDRSRNRFANSNFTNCKGFAKKVLADNPGKVYRCKDPNKVCRRGYYKVMSFVAPSNIYGNSTGDFHWYRQNKAVRYRIKAGDTVAGLARFFKVTPYVIRKSLGHQIRSKNALDGKIANNSPRFPQKGPLLVPGRIIMFPINLWSHKQGWSTGPQLIDASGKTISDPRKADRKYGYNYSKFCSAYCVKASGARTGLVSGKTKRV